MWLKTTCRQCMPFTVRHFSRVSPPPRDCGESVIRVSNNITHLGPPKAGYKPRQLLSLPPFPSHPLPGKNVSPDSRTTAISWMKYYFSDVDSSVIQSHFNKGLVKMECRYAGQQEQTEPVRIKHNEVMKTGSTIYVPVSIAESRISRRFDTIPSGSLCPNADEIQYLQRLDSALLVLNKPPKVPVKGNMAVHNSMDALAAAALCYDYDEGPKLVHRLDRESSGILLMGRSKESISHLHWLFSDANKTKSSLKAWNDACEATYQKYWALVIGTPKEKEGLICAPLTKVSLNGGKAERVMLAYGSGLEASQEAVTEYRVLGPTISGCSWLELRPLTHHKHQIRVHCAEALGTPIVGDYKELVIPNVAKHLEVQNALKSNSKCKKLNLKGDVLRFVASMPSHMKISWNLMSSYLV
ncbi:hypothetical protein OSB04_008490 [Centaurea solstitialis]|uniref:Pseudouridine synthase RsuA/RluA-like domain-containing protein n=1 Tax=Centaurea solstitialis TaxID=347529 RepID=A0AA38WRG2_9ASTR|nr:hypothetical protein OSB04_008490 [Centaurea solstitialis]